jgi:hypothetical protein
MSAKLDTLSLVELTAHFNALPGVTPVKKFPSKAVALARIEKAAPKPARAVKQKPAPRVKVAATLELGSGLTSPLESRRAPLGDTLERTQALVAKFGGKGSVTIAEAASALATDAQDIKRRVKRLRSWFGPEAVTRKGGSIIIHVTK